MKCVNCGRELPDGTKFCPYCGTGQMMRCVNCDQELPGGTKFCPYCGAKQMIYTSPEPAEQPSVNVQLEPAEQPLANVQPESSERPPVNRQPDTLEQIPANEPAEIPEQGAENASGQIPAEAAARELAEGTAPEPSEKTEEVPVQETTEVPAQEAAEEPAEAPEQKPVNAETQIPVQPGETVNWVPYLVLSILSTVCCCVPFGIVAIVYAVRINSLVGEGKFDEARSAAKTARIWIIVAFVVGIIFDIVVFLFIFISGAGYYGGIYDVIRRTYYY